MADIVQKAFSNAVCWNQAFVFVLKCLLPKYPPDSKLVLAWVISLRQRDYIAKITFLADPK